MREAVWGHGGRPGRHGAHAACSAAEAWMGRGGVDEGGWCGRREAGQAVVVRVQSVVRLRHGWGGRVSMREAGVGAGRPARPL